MFEQIMAHAMADEMEKLAGTKRMLRLNKAYRKARSSGGEWTPKQRALRKALKVSEDASMRASHRRKLPLRRSMEGATRGRGWPMTYGGEKPNV